MRVTAILASLLVGVARAAPLSSPADVPEQKIVGGDEVSPKFKHSFVVSVQFKGQASCGGSLIRKNVVLTAAHCVTNNKGKLLKPKHYKAKVHRHDLSAGDNENTCSKTLSVKRLIKHPDYDTKTLDNDIALMELDDEAPCAGDQTKMITYTDGKPADWPNNGKKAVWVAGWGATNKNGDTYPDKLREVEVDTMPNSECNNLFGGNQITNNMICAKRKNKDSCFGDSGGPLWVAGANGPAYQVGVVSWGPDRCATNQPGVYALLWKYTQWINSKFPDGGDGDGGDGGDGDGGDGDGGDGDGGDGDGGDGDGGDGGDGDGGDGDGGDGGDDERLKNIEELLQAQGTLLNQMWDKIKSIDDKLSDK